ncbi:MAG: GNAT family N-acetyltransferase [Pseudomonadota bacterium]
MRTTFDVRPATLADLSAVDALLGRSYPALLKTAYPPSILVTAIPLISKANPRLLASGTYFVVTDGDAVIGAGGWTREQPGRGGAARSRIGHIRHVVTDHRRVREGVGKSLMLKVFQTAHAGGVEVLECLSTRVAVPFYDAMGFETVGPTSIALRQGIEFPAIHMRKSLA